MTFSSGVDRLNGGQVGGHGGCGGGGGVGGLGKVVDKVSWWWWSARYCK